MRIVIHREYDDYEPVILGYVDADIGDPEEIDKVVADEWSAFQETEPDSDGLFIEWLLENTGWGEFVPDIQHEVIVN